MLRDALTRVGSERIQARLEKFKQHALAAFIKNGAAREARNALGDLAPGLLVEGSPGKGNWADVPWIAVFDPLVTETATKGYYVVYLFHRTEPELHLSLNQGTTAVRLEFKGDAPSVLKDRAALMRARLPEFLDQFDTYEMELGSRHSLPRDYQAGHAFGRRYDLHALPSEQQLRADLQSLARAYLSLTYRGGLDPSPEGAESDEGSPAGALSKPLAEIRRYKMHRKIERNGNGPTAAKRFHGLKCQACKFEFTTKYGELGDGFIEAHHLKPLSSLAEGVPVVYDVEKDFAVLCSNCHRMIHRMDDPSDLDSFRRLIKP